MSETPPPVRKRRVTFNEPGHAHELTFSCHQRLPLLSKDRTRQWFIDALDEARHAWRFEVWAYVVMPEHAHLLVLPLDEGYDIASILKAVKQPVARHATDYLRANAPGWLERLKVTRPSGRTEYRFWLQGGGYDRNVTEPRTAWEIVRYFHDNPVRRGLVADPLDWPWSSARCYAGWDDVVFKVDGRPPDC
jgi:putative transposase